MRPLPGANGVAAAIRQELVHTTDGLDSYVIDACQWGEKFFLPALPAFKLDRMGTESHSGLRSYAQ